MQNIARRIMKWFSWKTYSKDFLVWSGIDVECIWEHYVKTAFKFEMAEFCVDFSKQILFASFLNEGGWIIVYFSRLKHKELG